MTTFVILCWEGGYLFQQENKLKQLFSLPIWKRSGPDLPIEFSRKTDAGSLSAVIDFENGTEMKTLWSSWKHTSTNEEDPIISILKTLRELIGCPNNNQAFGFVSPLKESNWSNPLINQRIIEWKKQQSDDLEHATILWCDFGPNFDSFSPKTAVNFVTNSNNELSQMTNILTARDIDTPVKRLTEKGFLRRRCAIQTGQVFGHYIASKEAIEFVKHWIVSHTYFGRNNYCEYVEGNIPIVLAAPHGGRIIPLEIPNRTTGVDDGDSKTIELSCEMFNAIVVLCSSKEPKIPHLIINHLDRRKMDANRSLAEAIDIGSSGQIYAEQAWKEYHTFIEIAKRRASSKFGKAHFFDIHGNTMSTKTMIGYLTRKVEFEGDHSELLIKLSQSSMRALVEQKKESYDIMELFVGSDSLAVSMEEGGFECTPIGKKPYDWGGPGYFNGGYSTLRHGSYATAGNVNSTQFETPRSIRKTEESRRKYGVCFAKAVIRFFEKHYQIDLTS